MADVDDEGVRTIGQPGQLVVHHLECRAAGRPDIDVDGPSREDLFQPPGDDLSHRQPGMIGLAPSARFADDQELERTRPGIGVGGVGWKPERKARCRQRPPVQAQGRPR